MAAEVLNIHATNVVIHVLIKCYSPWNSLSEVGFVCRFIFGKVPPN